MKDRVTIVIPVYRRPELTERCLDTLLGQATEAEIVVVDDASDDGTAALLASYATRIRSVTLRERIGFAGACNAGAAVAAGAELVFLNNDTLPHEGWLAAMRADLHARPKAAIGARLLYPDGSIQHAGVVFARDGFPLHLYRGFPGSHPAVLRSRSFQAVTGACLLVPRAIFDELGGFDEAFVNGYEDVDLCLRLHERGYDVRYCAEAAVTHFESASRARKDPEENIGLYRSRWANRVRNDEADFYLADGLVDFIHHARTVEVAVSAVLGAPSLLDPLGETTESQLIEQAHRISALQERARELIEASDGQADRFYDPAGEILESELSSLLESVVASGYSPPSSRPVAILGMHRSGTSAVGRVVEALGLTLGPPDQIMMADPHVNPRGFFERDDVRDLNDQLLDRLGGTWWQPPLLPAAWERNPDLDPLRNEARAIVASFGAGRWMVKDPRLSFTLPFWRALVGQIDCVICLRHPEEVIGSLVRRERRDGLPLSSLPDSHWANLWLEYVEAALAQTRDTRRLLIDHRKLLQEPAGQIARLARFLDVHDDPERDARLAQLVELSLWRQRDAGVFASATAASRRRYRELEPLSTVEPRRGGRPADNAFRKAGRALLERDRRIERLLSTSHDQLTMISELEREKSASEAGMAELQRIADERGVVIEAMTSEQETLRKASSERSHALERMAAELRTLREAADARQTIIAELEQKISENGAAGSRSEARMAELQRIADERGVVIEAMMSEQETLRKASSERSHALERMAAELRTLREAADARQTIIAELEQKISENGAAGSPSEARMAGLQRIADERGVVIEAMMSEQETLRKASSERSHALERMAAELRTLREAADARQTIIAELEQKISENGATGRPADAEAGKGMSRTDGA